MLELVSTGIRGVQDMDDPVFDTTQRTRSFSRHNKKGLHFCKPLIYLAPEVGP